MHETFQKIYDSYHQDLYQFLFYMVKDKIRQRISYRRFTFGYFTHIKLLKEEAARKHGCFQLQGMWRLTGFANSKP